MRIAKNSVSVEELTDEGKPYKLWSGDAYQCPACGHQIVSGFGRRPLAEHYQPDYAKTCELLGPVVRAL